MRDAFCAKYFYTAFAVHKIDRRCEIFCTDGWKISPRVAQSENQMVQKSLISSNVF
jgi:hypothetical protein